MEFCHKHGSVKVNRNGRFYCGPCVLEIGRKYKNDLLEQSKKCPNDPSHGVLLDAVTDTMQIQLSGPIYVCPFCPGQEWDHYPLQKNTLSVDRCN